MTVNSSGPRRSVHLLEVLRESDERAKRAQGRSTGTRLGPARAKRSTPRHSLGWCDRHRAGAYGPGSRRTNGTSIPDNLFPKHAVGISYEGNGLATKLTNDEINASYWKGFDDDPDKGPGFLAGGASKGISLGNQQATNKLVVRYDVVTVLQRDRKVAYDQLYSWANLNAYTSSHNSMFQGWLKFNSPKIWDTGQENGNYWEMNNKSSSDHIIYLDFSYGNFPQYEIRFNQKND